MPIYFEAYWIEGKHQNIYILDFNDTFKVCLGVNVLFDCKVKFKGGFNERDFDYITDLNDLMWKFTVSIFIHHGRDRIRKFSHKILIVIVFECIATPAPKNMIYYYIII